MFDLASIVTYVAVVIGLFLIPGPAVLLVITRTLQGGRKVGIATGLGIASGDLIHTLCAALGLSAILMTSALAFNVVKTAGACYLIYLGARAFFAKSSTTVRTQLADVTSTQAFFQAVGAEVLNPKTAIFFPGIPATIHSPGVRLLLESIRSAWLDIFGAQRDLYQSHFHHHSSLEPVDQRPFKAPSVGRKNNRDVVCCTRGESRFSAAIGQIWRPTAFGRLC